MFVHLRHVGSLGSRRARSPLVRLMVGKSEEGGPDPPQGVLTQNWVGTEPNRTVTCIVLKATVKDRRTTSSLPQ
ncbi:hypothetical protein TNCV_2572151 [Trichonephila clavipes]|nr:hypothetical protein TNCV_2572151 [Trichonephila clavipes]